MPSRVQRQPISEQRSPTTKRARTRARVLDAAMDCVRESGIDSATASRIATRCGLSWGVIQYHFGDRAGLLLALLERAFERLDEHIATLAGEEPDVASRVVALMDRTWALLAADDYRVLLEVQLSLGGDPQSGSKVKRRSREMRSKLRELWRKVLPECAPASADAAQRLAITALRGLALERAVDRSRASYAAERRAAAGAVLQILGLSDARHNP